MKNLDDIIIEDEVKERIRPLFEQATASGDISFEHEFQWQVYCDLLDAFGKFIKNIHNATYVTDHEPRPYKVIYYTEELFSENYSLEEAIQRLKKDILPMIPGKLQQLSRYNTLIRQVSLQTAYPFEEYTKGNEETGCWINLDPVKLDKRLETIVYVANKLDDDLFKKLQEYVPEIIKNNMIRSIDALDELSAEEMTLFIDNLESKKRFRDTDDLLSLFLSDEYKQKQKGIARFAEARECAELTRRVPYRIIERIGEGSGRVAYKAWDNTDKCYVTVKVTKEITDIDSSNRREQEERYGEDGLAEREGAAARALTHPNIVRYFTRGKISDARAYIVEEYVGGITLQEFLRRGKLKGDRKKIARDILDAIIYLQNNGFVHRDIKPGNILCTIRDDAVIKVQLGDLELVKRIDPGKYKPEEVWEERPMGRGRAHFFIGKHRFVSTENHGSRMYTAPEVLLEKRLSYSADLFSLGIVMHELFTGEHPFASDDYDKRNKDEIPRNICNATIYRELDKKIKRNKNIPERYRSIIRKCLQYDPEKRYLDARMIGEHIAREDFWEQLKPSLIGMSAAIVMTFFVYNIFQKEISEGEDEIKIVKEGKAEDDLKQQVPLEQQQSAAAYAQYADSAYRNKSYEEAIHYYNIALTLEDRLWQAHYGLGNAYVATGDLIHAEQEYKAVLELNPQHVGSNKNLCLVLQNLKRVEAREHCIKANYER